MPSGPIKLSDAKARLSQITEEINRTGRPMTVMKNNKPWVTISPAASANQLKSPPPPFGMLKKYADPKKRALEEIAYKEAAEAKHALS
jgi:antitoxin Phd